MPKYPWVSVKQAAEEMGVSYRTVYRMVDRQQIQYRRIGLRRIMVNLDSIVSMPAMHQTDCVCPHCGESLLVTLTKED